MDGSPLPVRSFSAPSVLAELWFSLVHRLRGGSRVSPGSDLKQPGRITLGARCKIHRGAQIDASVGTGVQFAERVSIGRGAMIQGSRGGVAIGAGTEVNNYAVINGAGGVTIGADCLVGPHACIVSYGHEYRDRERPIRTQGYRYAPIVIEDDVWIGAHAVVLAGVRVGRGAVLGAGSVVTRDVEPYTVVAGVPARAIARRGERAA